MLTRSYRHFAARWTHYSIRCMSSTLSRSQQFSTQSSPSPVSDLIADAMKEAQSKATLPNTPDKSLDTWVPREWTFKTASIDTSPKKAMLVVRMLKNLSARQALEQMEFTKRKTAIYVKRMINRALASIRHNTLYAINEKKANVRPPPPTPDHIEVARVIVNKGLYKKDIRYHGRGRFGEVHHPTCRVKVTFREILDEEVAKGFLGRSFGRKKTEFEQLVAAFKKDRSGRHRIRPTTPVRPAECVWSRKNWKYVTSEKWLNPEKAYAKQKV